MLVLKSILRGEFAAPARSTTRKQDSGSSLVSAVTTLEESTTRDDDDDEADFSVGTTLPGDSFVLDVDWTESAETVTYYHPVLVPAADGSGSDPHLLHNTDMNGSMEDPYLLPIESMRRRLCRPDECGGSPSEGKGNASATIAAKQNTPPTASSTVPSSSSNNNGPILDYQRAWETPTDQHQQHVKSLGTFQFPVSNKNNALFIFHIKQKINMR